MPEGMAGLAPAVSARPSRFLQRGRRRPAFAFSTSAFTMRPFGPEPLIRKGRDPCPWRCAARGARRRCGRRGVASGAAGCRCGRGGRRGGGCGQPGQAGCFRCGGRRLGLGPGAEVPAPMSSALSPSSEKNRDGGVDLHALGAFGHEDLADHALVHGLELHRGLVGLDLGEDVTGRHGVAFLDQPLGERAVFHRGREGGHQDFGGHGRGSPLAPALSVRVRA
jgi:hypothetical protein